MKEITDKIMGFFEIDWVTGKRLWIIDPVYDPHYLFDHLLDQILDHSIFQRKRISSVRKKNKRLNPW